MYRLLVGQVGECSVMKHRSVAQWVGRGFRCSGGRNSERDDPKALNHKRAGEEWAALREKGLTMTDAWLECLTDW